MKNKMEEDKLTKEKFDQTLEKVISKLGHLEKITVEDTKRQVETTITFATSKENIETIQQAIKEFYSHTKTETNEPI